MKQALYLLASTKIHALNRSPEECGGIGGTWSHCWAFKGDSDAPDFELIDEDDLPSELDSWGLVVVVVEYDGTRAYAIGNRPATVQEVADAMVDAGGWLRA